MRRLETCDQAIAEVPNTRLGLEPEGFLRRALAGLRRPGVWQVALALAAGFTLRIVWVSCFKEFDDDSEVYATIARNILVHHAYALDNPFHLTLIRMPGYPVFMAAVFSIFGMMNYDAVRWLQIFIDMGTCLLVAGYVREHVSRRAAIVALWIACLNPFTANYVAIPMTECLSIFFVALGIFAAGRLVRSINTGSRRRGDWLLLTVAALIGSIGMRPDGVLLAAAIVGGIWWYTRKSSPSEGLRSAFVCAILTMLPLVPWTLRNYRAYHVIEPLAPRSAMDPTEISLEGFNRWFTTWEVDFVSVGEIWWRGDSETIDIGLLPRRAFDSPEEYRADGAIVLGLQRSLYHHTGT